jgi:predicted ATPase
MHIEALALKNYKAFKSISIDNIPKYAVFVGANGTGKSSLFDVFGLLKDSLIHNVSNALARRGGYKEVVTRGEEGPIKIELKFRVNNNKPLVTYTLEISEDNDSPIVERETLRYRRGQSGQPWKFLDFSRGRGIAITNEYQYSGQESEQEREEQSLVSPNILAIKSLGQLKKFPVANSFRQLIENWHVSDFHIDQARSTQDAGFAEHLSPKGANLSLVAKYMYDHHRDTFNTVLETLQKRIPGINDVRASTTDDGRILLKFQDGNFKDPFVARYVSDGTIKMFAYLVLLYDPSPHPLLCIEEPENQLYPHLLTELCEEFRSYAKKGGQVFVSTHSPDFLNGVKVDELFFLNKSNGMTSINRIENNTLVNNLYKEGDKLGYLWKQNLLDIGGE